MIKFLITPDRFAEACNVIEYLNASGNNLGTAIRIAPRFIVNAEGEYIIKPVLDDDGDIASYENSEEALMLLANITPKRLEKLSKELMEAAKAIVNPPSGAT